MLCSFLCYFWCKIWRIHEKISAKTNFEVRQLPWPALSLLGWWGCGCAGGGVVRVGCWQGGWVVGLVVGLVRGEWFGWQSGSGAGGRCDHGMDGVWTQTVKAVWKGQNPHCSGAIYGWVFIYKPLFECQYAGGGLKLFGVWGLGCGCWLGRHVNARNRYAESIGIYGVSLTSCAE